MDPGGRSPRCRGGPLPPLPPLTVDRPASPPPVVLPREQVGRQPVGAAEVSRAPSQRDGRLHTEITVSRTTWITMNSLLVHPPFPQRLLLLPWTRTRATWTPVIARSKRLSRATNHPPIDLNNHFLTITHRSLLRTLAVALRLGRSALVGKDLGHRP